VACSGVCVGGLEVGVEVVVAAVAVVVAVRWWVLCGTQAGWFSRHPVVTPSPLTLPRPTPRLLWAHLPSSPDGYPHTPKTMCFCSCLVCARCVCVEGLGPPPHVAVAVRACRVNSLLG
jgi:hypothetical protein